MVAVLLVVANHLRGWPHGGFVGVDVFFVISGFLITGNLLRMVESRGNVRFKTFYANRIRRIFPAATVFLVLTVAMSSLVFRAYRVQQIGWDALFAFGFVANWWFASHNTNYFAAGSAGSPVQHYWSLSVEEQFYLVWPVLVFSIGAVVSHYRRRWVAGFVIGVIVAVSFGWSLYQTSTSPALAYLNTFGRVWELGIGAVLAIFAGTLARIPLMVRPWLSWGGLGAIAAGALIIASASQGFPAPWALLPVLGSALLISSAIGAKTNNPLLCNAVSVYIGDISYSLYLAHWPVIVFLGALMPRGGWFYLAVLSLSFALAIFSYHFVETPCRNGVVRRPSHLKSSTSPAPFRNASGKRVLAASILLIVAIVALAGVARRNHSPAIEADSTRSAGIVKADVRDDDRLVEPPLGPAGIQLQQKITEALAATQWPVFRPPMDVMLRAPAALPDLVACAVPQTVPPEGCVWGSPTATTRIVLVGDSIALGYAGPLKELAVNSGGQIRIYNEALPSCPFVSTQPLGRTRLAAACPGRKRHAVDLINSIKPDVVIIANVYSAWWNSAEPADSMRDLIETFRANTRKVVWLSAPPISLNIGECFSVKSNSPNDCVGHVHGMWRSVAHAERSLAASLGGIWIDSRPWFCAQGACPAFVGSTATWHDEVHMSPEYGKIIMPALAESMVAAGLWDD